MAVFFVAFLGVVMPSVSFANSQCRHVSDAVDAGEKTIKAALVLECARTAGFDEFLPTMRHSMDFRREDVAFLLLSAFVDDGGKLPAASVDIVELFNRAVLMDQPRVVSYFLTLDTDLANQAGPNGRTPIENAALGGAYRAAQKLIQHGVEEGLGAAMVLATARSRAVAYAIAEYDEAWRGDEETAAKVAAAAIQYTDEPFLQFLMDLGLEFDTDDESGNPLSFYAPHHRDEHVGERNWYFLRNHGVDVTAQICGSIDETQFQHIREFGPEWYARVVAGALENCRRTNQ